MPTGRVLPCFERGDAAAIFHDLLEDIRSADLAIVNLECPLTDVDSPIPKVRSEFAGRRGRASQESKTPAFTC